MQRRDSIKVQVGGCSPEVVPDSSGLYPPHSEHVEGESLQEGGADKYGLQQHPRVHLPQIWGVLPLPWLL